MPVIKPVIRPPSEAYSFLLQLTTGCSSNSCSFCGAYLNKTFRIKDLAEIKTDIEIAAIRSPHLRRVFLMDGDALVLPNEQLLPVLKLLQQRFPMLSRVSSYANGYNIINRTPVELRELKTGGLKLIYMGLESGSQKVLESVHKSSSSEEMVSAVRAAASAGIKTSLIVLLGLGGKKYSSEHVKYTIEAVNKMQPAYLSFLSVMLVPGTGLYERAVNGDFEELGPAELLKESKNIIQGLELKKTVFRSNHASNYLNLEGRLPRDKSRLIKMIDEALKGDRVLRPENVRAL